MAEGLGTGLQNLLQQFESAWHLRKMPLQLSVRAFAFLKAAPYIDPSQYDIIEGLIDDLGLEFTRAVKME